LLAAVAIWGANFAAIKFLLGKLDAFDVMFVRGAGGAFFFALVLLVFGRPLVTMRRPDALRLLGIGVLGITVMNAAMIGGQNLLPAALASLIVTSNPIHTAVISRVLTGEPLGRRKLGGIALAFLGFLVVLFWGSGDRVDLGTGRLQGVALMALAPFCWAFYSVLSKPLLVRYPASHVTGYGVIAGTVGFLPLAVIRPGTVGRIADLPPGGWVAALFATALSFVVAYLLWGQGLRALAPSQTAVYAYLVPVFGLLAAWLVLGERPTAFLVLGGAIILGGVFLTNSAPSSPAPGTPRVAPVPVPVARRVGERGS